MKLLSSARRTLLGDKVFYKTVLALVVPVIIQSTVTNFVSLLDNLMVGALGTAEMSGVAIANQLLFIFNLAVFGGLSGAGIFGAQFFGAGDIGGLRNTFRIKLMESLMLFGLAATTFLLMGPQLITLFLQGEGEAEMAEQMLANGNTYLKISIIGLLPFAVSQCYSGTLREMGETRMPMLASIAAVGTNALFNYLLIFGKFGFPCMGVAGAATATVLSRFVELFILVFAAHRHSDRFTFLQGAFRTFRVPASLLKDVVRMGLPLLLNELLWSMGISTLTAVYSRCSLTVVGALSITSTITNLFNVVHLSMGTAVSIMVGQALGADDNDRALSTTWKLAFFSFLCAVCMGLLLILASPYVTGIYRGVTADVRETASSLLVIAACIMPIQSFAHVAYFTLRSGGKTIITFLFDAGYTWVISVPLALLMVSVLNAGIFASYSVVEGMNLSKCVLGFILIKKGIWMQNIAKAHA
ncbi:MAG: MATE family efflux transporter [Clostridia bacterium]|nr:MATE family efflux transporter [Clostridia bacterium]